MAKTTARAKKNGKTKAKSAPRTPAIQLTLDRKLDILGVALVGVAVVTILSMLSQSQGDLTGWWIGELRKAFGLGVFVVPIVIGLIGLWLLLRSFERTPRLTGEQSLGLVLIFLVALTTIAEFNKALGGSLGVGLMNLFDNAIGWIGTIVLLVVGWLISIVLLFNVAPSEIAKWVTDRVRRVRANRSAASIKPGQPIDIVINGNRSANATPDGNGALPGAGQSFLPPQLATPVGDETAAQPSTRVVPRPRPAAPPSGMLGDQSMENPLLAPPASALSDTPASGPLYPHIIGNEQPWVVPKVEDILESGDEAAMSEDDLRKKAHIIEDTLRELGAECKVTEVNPGPAVTQFGVEPGWIIKTREIKERDEDGNIIYDENSNPRVHREEVSRTKIKVSRITALADDLALALAAKTIRIEAPVPGKNFVGIEVPNGEVATVTLRDVIESEAFQKLKSPLRIALGQNVSGQSVAANLSNMPHLLIAGTTGSGKSVCVNAIIACLMTYNTPDELKFLMVDPKRVELTTYNGVPHLIAPVVVDLERVVGVLQWVTREMDERYRKFAKSGSRNIDDFNQKATTNSEPRLPYIVVIIDELADLMMLAPDETEKTICRLAQMARATGIHLIIATQRPSVDVVTGLIKANFPARIAFSVASSVDSRVILDTTGAERLLGRGDMLYVAPEIGAPQRLQGCYVSDREIHKLVRYWKGIRGTEPISPVTGLTDQSQSQPIQPPLFDALRAELDQASANGEDDLLQRAIDVVKVQRKASISLLQRQLRIGYTRAARLIDLMEEKGIVGRSEEGNSWREVLLELPPLPNAVHDRE